MEHWLSMSWLCLGSVSTACFGGCGGWGLGVVGVCVARCWVLRGRLPVVASLWGMPVAVIMAVVVVVGVGVCGF